MHQKYVVVLTEAERAQLQQLIAAGTAPARKLAHARVRLKADKSPGGPGWVDAALAEAGLEAALNRRAPRRLYARKLDGAQEARLVALACSEPPAGQARWSLRLLADKLVELQVVEAISHQTVRRVLKKTSSSRG